MNTFALVLLMTIGAPGAAPATDASVIDHDLSRDDCAAMVAAFQPSDSTLPGGVTVTVTATCQGAPAMARATAAATLRGAL